MIKVMWINGLLAMFTCSLLLLSGCDDGNESDTQSDTNQEATSITYTDYLGQSRTAAANAGSVESQTGLGYQHTLFDRADNKCQHCHNELYDSWQSSMHAKAWSDKIFQSKHQDFLRTHIAKIGTNPTGEREYTTDVFKGAAQTCIKCHAPAARYSGDFNVTIEKLEISGSFATTEEFTQAKAEHEANLAVAADYDPSQPSTVVATSAMGELYKASYHIGNPANREGVNCSTCHTIETVRMMSERGADGGAYTLAKTIRVGPHGPVKRSAGDTLYYSADGVSTDMNQFFRLWGPEIYTHYDDIPKSSGEFDGGNGNPKQADGRFTFSNRELSDPEGEVHYTGGPFYGPYGVTGLDNHNDDDATDRHAHVNPHFDKDSNNHFGDYGKALCLSCHQRSAGAASPDGGFMELCSTWLAMSDGVGNNYEDSETSPKCQHCHMPRVADKRVLHQWAKPDELFTQNDMHLTAHFDPDAATTDATNNPVIGEWLNDHAFVGGSKIGAPNFLAKIQSGFAASLSASADTDGIHVSTTIQNKTAHMFPGAHPMRRVLTRVVVADETGEHVSFMTATGLSTFSDIENTVVSGQSEEAIDATGKAVVTVGYDENRTIDFPGQTPDLDGSAVVSQKFSGNSITVTAPDGTVKHQSVDQNGKIVGTVRNAAIVESSDTQLFTRIYGHETGKLIDGEFVVRPGFDSNIVGGDNRLLPNETETYNLTYEDLPAGTYTVSYRVYYMQKGAGGVFPTAADGFLDNTVNMEKKLLISEVGAYSQTITLD